MSYYFSPTNYTPTGTAFNSFANFAVPGFSAFNTASNLASAQTPAQVLGAATNFYAGGITGLPSAAYTPPAPSFSLSAYTPSFNTSFGYSGPSYAGNYLSSSPTSYAPSTSLTPLSDALGVSSSPFSQQASGVFNSISAQNQEPGPTGTFTKLFENEILRDVTMSPIEMLFQGAQEKPSFQLPAGVVTPTDKVSVSLLEQPASSAVGGFVQGVRTPTVSEVTQTVVPTTEDLFSSGVSQNAPVARQPTELSDLTFGQVARDVGGNVVSNVTDAFVRDLTGEPLVMTRPDGTEVQVTEARVPFGTLVKGAGYASTAVLGTLGALGIRDKMITSESERQTQKALFDINSLNLENDISSFQKQYDLNKDSYSPSQQAFIEADIKKLEQHLKLAKGAEDPAIGITFLDQSQNTRSDLRMTFERGLSSGGEASGIPGIKSTELQTFQAHPDRLDTYKDISLNGKVSFTVNNTAMEYTVSKDVSSLAKLLGLNTQKLPSGATVINNEPDEVRRALTFLVNSDPAYEGFTIPQKKLIIDSLDSQLAGLNAFDPEVVNQNSKLGFVQDRAGQVLNNANTLIDNNRVPFQDREALKNLSADLEGQLEIVKGLPLGPERDNRIASLERSLDNLNSRVLATVPSPSVKVDDGIVKTAEKTLTDYLNQVKGKDGSKYIEPLVDRIQDQYDNAINRIRLYAKEEGASQTEVNRMLIEAADILNRDLSAVQQGQGLPDDMGAFGTLSVNPTTGEIERDWTEEFKIWGAVAGALSPFLALWMNKEEADERRKFERQMMFDKANLEQQHWMERYGAQLASGDAGGGGGGGGGGTPTGRTDVKLVRPPQ